MKIALFILIIVLGLIIGYISGMQTVNLYRHSCVKRKTRKKYSFGNEIVITKLESNAKEYGSSNEDFASKEY